MVVAVRLSPELKKTSSVKAEVEAVILSLHFAVHVPVRRAFVILAESSVVLVDRPSPHPESRKILKNSRNMFFIIICVQKL